MPFEDIEAEISLLLSEMQGQMGDQYEILARLKQILETCRAEGLPVPEDLKKLETRLEQDIAAGKPEQSP